VEANVCIYANATILGGNTVIGKKQYYWWKFMGYQNHPGRSLVTNTTTTEVKIKELR
jgi:serine O-acetyltransferase